MTSEQIERLAMDLACGQMNEDAEALFRAYLEDHPEQKKAADGFGEFCDTCQRSLDSEPVPVPALTSEILSKSFQRPLCLKIYYRAAVLLIAVFLGFGIGRLDRPHTSGTQHVPPASNRNTRVPAARLEKERGRGFWQEKIHDLEKPKLWAVRNKSDKTETFWGHYRKEFNYVQPDNQ